MAIVAFEAVLPEEEAHLIACQLNADTIFFFVILELFCLFDKHVPFQDTCVLIPRSKPFGHILALFVSAPIYTYVMIFMCFMFIIPTFSLVFFSWYPHSRVGQRISSYPLEKSRFVFQALAVVKQFGLQERRAEEGVA